MRVSGAVDIGGTGTKVGIVGEDGSIVRRTAVPTSAAGEPAPLVSAIVAAVRPMLDAAARRALECRLEGLASLSPLLVPDRIVVGGGVAAAGELPLERTRASYRTHAAPELRERVPIVGSAFDGREGMVGAASLLLDPCEPHRPRMRRSG